MVPMGFKVGNPVCMRYGPRHVMTVVALEDDGETVRCEWVGAPLMLTWEQMFGQDPIPESVRNSEGIPAQLLIPAFHGERAVPMENGSKG